LGYSILFFFIAFFKKAKKGYSHHIPLPLKTMDYTILTNTIFIIDEKIKNGCVMRYFIIHFKKEMLI
jgi:hypothetical protein